MKNTISTICFCLISIIGYSQVWTEPVNISNLDGNDKNVVLSTDRNGTVHCTWVNDIQPNFTKIYYTYSYDFGSTWCNPIDISKNNDNWVDSPSIIADSSNRIYIFYDYDVGSPNQTMILMRSIENGVLSSCDTVSCNMPGSRISKLVFDNTGRLYCFWFHDNDNGSSFYRYYEDDIWSDILPVLPGSHFLGVIKISCDSKNVLHLLAGYHNENQSYLDDRLVYMTMMNGEWSDIEEITPVTQGPGYDLDLDSFDNPHVVYRQKTPGTNYYNDSTMYISNRDVGWINPELIVQDPLVQKILLDSHDFVNIFDVEKTNSGSMLVHYTKSAEQWNGTIIDTSNWNVFHYDIMDYQNSIFCVYVKPTENGTSEVYFSSCNVITNLKDLSSAITSNSVIRIFPNPFYDFCEIRHGFINCEDFCIEIFNMSGQLIRTINSENTNNEISIWDGRDNANVFVSSGYYLIRIIKDRNIWTKLVYKY